jgi:hypothetical protein
MVVLTAKDLLRRSIEFVSITPEGTFYNEDNLKELPLLYRYQQIMALLNALGIKGAFESFLKAEFMDSRSESDYEKLFREVKWVYHNNISARKLLKVGVGRLQATYLATFQYRLALHKTLHYYRKAIISDPLYLYPVTLVRGINSEMIKQVEVLDTFLSSVIDPECREIPMALMKSDYDYPDVDLELVDLDGF